MFPLTRPLFLNTESVVRTAEKTRLKGKHSWHRAPARESKVSKMKRSDSSPRLLSERSNWCWQRAAWHRWWQNKKEKSGDRGSEAFQSATLSDSFDFSPANKEDCYILPTPLERAELYPTQRSSLDKTADFLQTKFPLWSLWEKQVPEKQLSLTNMAGASVR